MDINRTVQARKLQTAQGSRVRNKIFLARAAGRQLTKAAHRRITSLVDSVEMQEAANMTAMTYKKNAIMFKDGTEYTEDELMSLRQAAGFSAKDRFKRKGASRADSTTSFNIETHKPSDMVKKRYHKHSMSNAVPLIENPTEIPLDSLTLGTSQLSSKVMSKKGGKAKAKNTSLFSNQLSKEMARFDGN